MGYLPFDGNFFTWDNRGSLVKLMSPKRFQNGSEYEQFDLDHDGVVTDEELQRSQTMLELELREEKAESQKLMAWVAVISMIIYAMLPLMPFVSESRLSTIAALSDMLFLSQASIVGLYFGATAYMNKK